MKMVKSLILCLVMCLIVAAPVFASGTQAQQGTVEKKELTKESVEKALLGEWYYIEPNPGELENGFVDSIRFFDEVYDGIWKKGSFVYIDYWNDGVVSYTPPADATGEREQVFTWACTEIYEGCGYISVIVADDYSEKGYHVIYFKFDPVANKLHRLARTTDESKKTAESLPWTEDGEQLWLNPTPYAYSRVYPEIPEGLVTHASVIAKFRGIELDLMNRFTGTWYYDVTEWTFNEDKTGLIDIPAMGTGDASQIKFTYDARQQSETGAVTLFVTLDDGGTITFRTEFGKESGGSVILKPSNGDDIKLTRIFDISNTPLTSEIMKGAFSIFTMGDYLSDVVE